MSEEKLRTKIRQEQIVLAAFELIASQGLKGLNVADVARRIGLVPSAIYRHFKSKDDIIDAVLDHIQEMLVGNVETVCEETSVALERLRRLMFRHVQLIRANVAIPRILFSDEIYFGRPGRKKTMYVSISDYLARVEAIIRQGQATGGIDPTIDPKTVSVMFLGLVQPTGLLWHISGGRFDVTKQAEKAWRLFSRTIAASDCEFKFTKIYHKGKKGEIMERASQDLMHEHDAILFSLKVLEEMCRRVESQKDVHIMDIADLIDFLKLFVDKCHHGKEEGFLFPAMKEAGIPEENSPIGVMLAEHTMGRNFIRQMQELVTGKAFREEAFGKAARCYISLMRAHIEKETNILFPMGDAKLSDAKQRELIESFEKYEEEVIGKGKHEELHKQLEAFNAKYLE